MYEEGNHEGGGIREIIIQHQENLILGIMLICKLVIIAQNATTINILIHTGWGFEILGHLQEQRRTDAVLDSRKDNRQ